MGWTYQVRPKGQSIKDFFAAKFAWENEGTRQWLADCAVVSLRTAYCAVSQTDKRTGETLTNAVVCQLDFAPHDGFNQGYRDVEESMGPREDGCPERILGLLSPVEEIYGPGTDASRWASEWRERCRERIRRRKEKPRLKTGSYLVFDDPIRFANGEKRSVFYIEDARRRLFAARPGAHAVRYAVERRLLDGRAHRVQPHDPAETPTTPPAARPASPRTAPRPHGQSSEQKPPQPLPTQQALFG